ncbi:MAG: winged helix-turn-helix domain-containing protein [Alphaproteobacteria bacterium]|nr:winged helix-turn-helix domain-containing protein [Alphaproteobacteria bacterium]
MHAGGGDAEISIGGWLLDTAYNTLLSPDGEVVKLTEKETAILRYLNGQQDDVTKDELLQAVWEYAEDVETHTLETHIYRLRQKIEDDPANPQIVVTTEKGYRLKV